MFTNNSSMLAKGDPNLGSGMLQVAVKVIGLNAVARELDSGVFSLNITALRLTVKILVITVLKVATKILNLNGVVTGLTVQGIVSSAVFPVLIFISAAWWVRVF